jgi:hypothetical protein
MTLTVEQKQDINQAFMIRRAALALSGRYGFGPSAFQRAVKCGHNAAMTAIEWGIKDGYFIPVAGGAPHEQWRVSEKGLELARKHAVRPSKVGQAVSPVSHSYALRSGASAYSFAIVVSMEPFVLVSERGDMRWQASVKPEFFHVIGEATSHELEIAMTRLEL